MIPVLTIRPAQGSEITRRAGAARGLEITAFPLSQVLPLPWTGPDPAEVDGLLIGSANAFAHGGPGLARFQGKPVYAVGPTTAKAAADAGFAVQLAGTGGLQRLLDQATARPARLLRLAGQRHVPITLPDGITLTTVEVYAMGDLAMPQAMVDLLHQRAVVLLHSAGAAEHFRRECMTHRLDLSRIQLAALGPRIAEAAGEGWEGVRWPDNPVDGALLDLAADMCH